ncbi:MAG TPA: VOC family protein [Phnomibacter sp.]|nr:VOC family protein [Phnomibacter sp.]
MKNSISWFEIPVTDLDRAQKFYENIFKTSLMAMDMGDIKMRTFPVDDIMDQNAVSGALILAGEFNTPSGNGTMVYLNANPDLQLVLDRIVAAGGTVVVPKTLISNEIGFMGVFVDSEGNRVALHSAPQG